MIRKKPIVVIVVFTLLTALFSAWSVFISQWNLAAGNNRSSMAMFENGLFSLRSLFSDRAGSSVEESTARIRRMVEEKRAELETRDRDGRWDVYIVLKDAEGEELYEFSSTDPQRRGGDERIAELRARTRELFTMAGQPFEGVFDWKYIERLKQKPGVVKRDVHPLQDILSDALDKGFWYTLVTPAGVTRVMVRASDRTECAEQLCLFAICRYDAAAYVLRDGPTRIAMGAAAAVSLLIGAAIAVFAVREQKKSLRLEKARRETLTAAQRRLEPTVAQIRQSCGSRLAGNNKDRGPAQAAADTQSLYEDILKLNGDIAALLETARKA